jgi:hypothetical protein
MSAGNSGEQHEPTEQHWQTTIHECWERARSMAAVPVKFTRPGSKNSAPAVG